MKRGLEALSRHVSLLGRIECLPVAATTKQVYCLSREDERALYFSLGLVTRINGGKEEQS